jgi:hypothetical protein
MKTGTFIVIITTIITLLLFTAILFLRKGWKCTEGHCEQVIIGGEYSSFEKCNTSCAKKHQNTVTFKESISEIPNYKHRHILDI